jgi:hypothetical protein
MLASQPVSASLTFGIDVGSDGLLGQLGQFAPLLICPSSMP